MESEGDRAYNDGDETESAVTANAIAVLVGKDVKHIDEVNQLEGSRVPIGENECQRRILVICSEDDAQGKNKCIIGKSQQV